MKVRKHTILFLFISSLFLISCERNEKSSIRSLDIGKSDQTPKKISTESFRRSAKEDLFFVKADTVFRYSLYKQPYPTSTWWVLPFKPYLWHEYIRKLGFKSSNYEDCVKIYWDNDEYTYHSAQPYIYDGDSRKRVKLILERSSYGKGFGNRYLRGIEEFGALFFNYRKNTLTLKNNFEGKVDISDLPIDNIRNEGIGIFNNDVKGSGVFKNGVIVRGEEKYLVGKEFGENIYKSRRIIIDTLSIINFSNLDYLCFGAEGINALATKKNMDLYTTEIPFIYLFKK